MKIVKLLFIYFLLFFSLECIADPQFNYDVVANYIKKYGKDAFGKIFVDHIKTNSPAIITDNLRRKRIYYFTAKNEIILTYVINVAEYEKKSLPTKKYTYQELLSFTNIFTYCTAKSIRAAIDNDILFRIEYENDKDYGLYTSIVVNKQLCVEFDKIN